MDSKTYAIGILSLTAVVLFVAQFIPVQPAVAGTAVRERDYSLVTTKSTAGGDSLYVADSRTGVVAVFTWDPGRRGVVIRDARMVTDAFTP
jgi:hypothetical protein